MADKLKDKPMQSLSTVFVFSVDVLSYVKNSSFTSHHANALVFNVCFWFPIPCLDNFSIALKADVNLVTVFYWNTGRSRSLCDWSVDNEPPKVTLIFSSCYLDPKSKSTGSSLDFFTCRKAWLGVEGLIGSLQYICLETFSQTYHLSVQ